MSSGKHSITWNVLEEYKSFVGDDIHFKVTVEQNINTQIVVSASRKIKKADKNEETVPGKRNMAIFFGAQLLETSNGVEVVNAGKREFAQAGVETGFIIKYVNDKKVNSIQEIFDITGTAKRTVCVECISTDGKLSYSNIKIPNKLGIYCLPFEFL